MGTSQFPLSRYPHSQQRFSKQADFKQDKKKDRQEKKTLIEDEEFGKADSHKAPYSREEWLEHGHSITFLNQNIKFKKKEEDLDLKTNNNWS
ncbi:MAG: hypothetical protein QNJ31_03735 [Candidatus Caenarcaniphilales bacterium]|nr:hypothetical protein [Candidatus Caenarcaniphilales bacterium]